MAKQRSLQTLINLARDARDAAARLLASERHNAAELQERKELLERYRGEYQLRLQEMLSEGVEAATWCNYQDFLASLDKAIDQAIDALRAQHEKVSRCRLDWQQEHLRFSSYDLLDDRRKAQEQVRTDRQEARHSDEIYNNIAVRAGLNQTPFNRHGS